MHFCFYEGSGSKLSFTKALQSNLVNTDTEGVIESARINGGVSIKRVEFRDNVMAFLPHGQRKLSVIMKCPYCVGICKAGIDCTQLYSSMFKIL